MAADPLDVALEKIRKAHGKGSIRRLGEEALPDVEVISTGSIALDEALGTGGLPRGRVIELFGPESSGKTSLALRAVALAQKAGDTAAFIDAEHALDEGWAQILGVDTDALLVSQPDYGEQALSIAEDLVKSGRVGVIVIDSVAALVPRAELDGEMGASHVGLQARMMSQALRKLTGALSSSRTCIIFINQLREKVGVFFGSCLHYDARVTLADGTQEKIGKIVNQRRPVDVLAYDETSGKVVVRRVVDWFDSGPAEEFYKVTVRRAGGSHQSRFKATRGHLVATAQGWRPVEELRPGDLVLQQSQEVLSDRQLEVIRASLMGDGSLRTCRTSSGLRLGHGPRQADYLEWKLRFFPNLRIRRSVRPDGAVHADLEYLPELKPLHEEVYTPEGKRFSDSYLRQVNGLGMAIWIMDDGCVSLRSKGNTYRTIGGTGRLEICVDAMTPDTRDRVVRWMQETWKLKSTALTRRREQWVIRVGTADTTGLLEMLACYFPPVMQYKLPHGWRGLYTELIYWSHAPRLVAVSAEVTSVISVSPGPRCRGRKYDIEVEGVHNFFADHVLVHNSETQPGGKALKFYSSVRMDIRRIQTLKDGTEAIGNRVRVKVVKNKCARPFRQAEFDLMFGEGISREAELIDLGVERGVIRKSGAFYSCNGESLGQGREKARLALCEQPALAAEIERAVRAAGRDPRPGMPVPRGSVDDNDPLLDS
jgi:recombination protein RecA